MLSYSCSVSKNDHTDFVHIDINSKLVTTAEAGAQNCAAEMCIVYSVSVPSIAFILFHVVSHLFFSLFYIFFAVHFFSPSLLRISLYF